MTVRCDGQTARKPIWLLRDECWSGILRQSSVYRQAEVKRNSRQAGSVASLADAGALKLDAYDFISG